MTVEQKIVDIMVQNLIEAGVPTFQGGGLVTANKEPPFSRAGESVIQVSDRHDVQAVIDSLKRKNNEARSGDGVTINVVCRN